jgi:hypothetical protein
MNNNRGGFIPVLVVIALVAILAIIVLAMFWPAYVIGACLIGGGLLMMIPGITPFPDPRIGLVLMVAGVAVLLLGSMGYLDGVLGAFA